MGKEAFNPIYLYCGIISFSTRTSRNIYQYRIYFSNKYKEGGEHSHGKKIAVFVGSLRKESYNRKMANALATHAPETLKLEIIEIGALPLYDQDLDDEEGLLMYGQISENR